MISKAIAQVSINILKDNLENKGRIQLKQCGQIIIKQNGIHKHFKFYIFKILIYSKNDSSCKSTFADQYAAGI